MAYILIWFIMANGVGYIEPLRVEFADMKCGLEGTFPGIQLDRPVNPTRMRWADPKATGKHCEIDVAQRVAALAHGEYHVATTVIGADRKFGEVKEYDDYTGPDPHTSDQWLRSITAPGLPGRPANFRVGEP
jgi:hypothetical protein